MRVCDTHVHSYRSFVGDESMSFQRIAERASALHINTIAITDHLMKPEDIDSLKITRQELSAFRNQRTEVAFLFGVEVCETASDGQTLLTKQLADEMGFEVIIGGVHETHMPPGASLEAMAQRQHKHHMLMMENPLIHILVHPWWLDSAEFQRLGIPWPEDMAFLPQALTVQLAHASRSTNTYIEISTLSGLCNRETSPAFKQGLSDYYRLLNREGALFAIGTDAHTLSDLDTISKAKELISTIGIGEDRLWQPPARTNGETK